MAELLNSVERSEVCKANGDVGSDDVCKRCRSIPWHEGPTREHRISTTPRESGCRVCRWFAKFGCTQIRMEGEKESLFPYFTNKRLLVKQTENNTGPLGLWSIVVSDRATQTVLQSLTPPFISFSRIKDLLNTCAEQHTDCSLPKQNHFVPNLRVIDCTTREVINAPANCEYVALSYVWGSVQSVNDDLASMQILPRVIEQSITVASKLGVQFLWIDRYCIDQRNEQHQSSQILQMSTIYRGAQLTIIAAAGQNPTHGLPGVEPYRRSPAHGYYEAVGSICLSALPWTILDGDAHVTDICNTVWASRAWTFQEAMFSRRRLLFTESQVIFSCDTSTRCEWGRELKNDCHLLKGLQWCVRARPHQHTIPPLRRACDIMQQYCVRKLTHDSDALNAIASTLNLIQKSDEYHIWGVPFRVCLLPFVRARFAIFTPSDVATLPDPSDVQMVQICLSWGHIQPQRRRRGFPSWSPLGWSPGDIEYYNIYQECVFLDTPHGKESLSTHLQCAKLDPAGMAQHISLLLRTRFVRVCKRAVPYGFGLDYEIALPLGQGFAHMSPIYWDGHVEVECEMKIAIISSCDRDEVNFMVLQAHDGYYERIGWSKFFPDSLTSWAEENLLWCLTDDKLEPISLSTDGNFKPLDEERLRAAFGDIDEDYFGYGQNEFQEEFIVLG